MIERRNYNRDPKQICNSRESEKALKRTSDQNTLSQIVGQTLENFPVFKQSTTSNNGLTRIFWGDQNLNGKNSYIKREFLSSVPDRILYGSRVDMDDPGWHRSMTPLVCNCVLVGDSGGFLEFCWGFKILLNLRYVQDICHFLGSCNFLHCKL